ncbi:hypothetical protein [Halobaculum rubrum]|uniref:hypothetical protein n=1 Tax=Halobaculum rubrum TaxID=2872158 RepID=UPI001CA4243D|nr:hypothetical protein [Halobaculum rubrum]QZY00521.1 hypothetical protein K6T25_05405 [Halobaculum rubrum]
MESGPKVSSILTPDQREYLRDKPSEISKANERVKRGRIRERIKAGIGDFDIVFNHLEARDREQLTDFDHESEFTTADREEELRDSQIFAEGLMSMVAFASQCADDMGIEVEDLFQASLQRMPQIDSVDVTVDQQRVNLFGSDILQGRLEQVEERFEAREQVTTLEMQMLFNQGRITSSDVEAYFEEIQ